MIKSFMLASATSLLLIAPSFSEANEVSRLWEVTNKKSDGTTQIFHVLGVSHNGLEAEYDSYFYEKIMPIFQKAKSYAFESAAIAPELVPACPLPLPDTPGNALLLNRARSMVSDVYYAKFSSVVLPAGISDTDKAEIRESHRIFADQLANKMSEYGLLLALKERLVLLQRDQSPPHRNAIGDYLFLNKGLIATESIDKPEEMVAAYCEQNAARAAAFSDELALFETTIKAGFSAPEMPSAEKDFRQYVEEKKLVKEWQYGSKEYWDSYVCKRNANWAKHISADAQLNDKFFALGLAHLLPSSWSDCPTLFELLKNTGMTIRIVE